MRLVWTPRARRARAAVIDHIAEDNPKAALTQLDEIDRQTSRLIDHPAVGRPGRLGSTRELVINRTPFILVYRIDGDTISILHCLHGAQQWPQGTM
jgi:toxin ParE1/3/4